MLSLTITGSIGVIVPHFDFAAAKRFDVTDDSITSGPLKEMLSVTKDRSPEPATKERGIVQDLVDEMFNRFKDIVREGRPKLDDEAIEDVTTGQVFTANQAITSGLIDKIGFLEDAIARAVVLANLEEESVRVIQYKTTRTLRWFLVEPLKHAHYHLRNACRVDHTRAWYLCSWWPAITTSYP